MFRGILSISLMFSSAIPSTAQELTLFSVGSGNLHGGYYATARSICAIFNRSDLADGMRCSPEPTLGSIYNIAMLGDGELDFAFVQSDWQRAAYLGESLFAGQPAQTDMRSVMSLYPESVTVLVGAGSGIKQITEIFDRRVDIGPAVSGRHATVVELLNRLGIGEDAFEELVELTSEQSLKELCEDRIDVAIFVTGHPSTLINRAITECGARLISMDSTNIRETFAETSDYYLTNIPAGTYPQQEDDVTSWAVYATVVTRANTPDHVVEAFVLSVLKQLKNLRTTNPLLSGLKPSEMRTQGLTAPLHPAATRAFDAEGG